jgi:hypothetical protein
MEDLEAGCTSRKCDYAINELNGSIGCVNGSGTCSSARMLSGGITDSHDAELEAASKEIQSILDGLEANANGRKLSFLSTDEGLFLAWVDHSRPPAKGSIRREDGHEKVAMALDLNQ